MTPATDKTRGRYIDTRTLMQIRSLELRARVVVQGFWNGIHRSPYHGFSVEFTEYRQYVPGDDLRYLDWRLYARSDRYYIKKFEDETNLRAITASRAQRTIRSSISSSLLLRVTRGGSGRRNISELKVNFSFVFRRMRWNKTGPAIASAPSKNNGAG